ncbi:hypothetical protein EON62_04145, partial [archaeon]
MLKQDGSGQDAGDDDEDEEQEADFEDDDVLMDDGSEDGGGTRQRPGTTTKLDGGHVSSDVDDAVGMASTSSRNDKREAPRGRATVRARAARSGARSPVAVAGGTTVDLLYGRQAGAGGVAGILHASSQPPLRAPLAQRPASFTHLANLTQSDDAAPRDDWPAATGASAMPSAADQYSSAPRPQPSWTGGARDHDWLHGIAAPAASPTQLPDAAAEARTLPPPATAVTIKAIQEAGTRQPPHPAEGGRKGASTLGGRRKANTIDRALQKNRGSYFASLAWFAGPQLALLLYLFITYVWVSTILRALNSVPLQIMTSYQRVLYSVETEVFTRAIALTPISSPAHAFAVQALLWKSGNASAALEQLDYILQYGSQFPELPASLQKFSEQAELFLGDACSLVYSSTAQPWYGSSSAADNLGEDADELMRTALKPSSSQPMYTGACAEFAGGIMARGTRYTLNAYLQA